MCGIFSLVRGGGTRTAETADLVAGTNQVRHRGPDDEGYLLWQHDAPVRVYAGAETAASSRLAHRLDRLPERADWRVALGHRRLSIVDLSAGGHQPMVHPQTGLAIAYNGEIYNYIELREELKQRGHRFTSLTDTEVLLAAWVEWGADCLPRLNGMFAFVLLDPRDGGTLHIVRDRYGVKPLYWAKVGEYLAFASEIKQIRALPDFRPQLDSSTARDYLAAGLLDYTRHTFDLNIKQLLGGERAVVRLNTETPRAEIVRWYELEPETWSGSDEDAALRFRDLLADSVRLRLRADVPVGSCLSGGLDSSAIVCLVSESLKAHGDHAGQLTVTACFEDQRFDEWRFAEQVIKQTDATPVRVWPTIERLQSELDNMLWHLDEPYGSTSQFSQWCVFAAAAEAGLKVMLDGQGSDEQLAGYAGNETSLLTGLLRRGAGVQLINETLAFHRKHKAWPVAQLLLASRNLAPMLDRILPARLKIRPGNPEWLKLDAPTHSRSKAPRNLNASLQQQTLETSLPVLLRYEDRNSMAWSIESRVPFMDYRLVHFLAGLPDRLKLSAGISKFVMREGLNGVLPESIRNRQDKMGFVTPEQVWLREVATDWFEERVDAALDVAPEIFNADEVKRLMQDTIEGRVPFTFTPWRILCFGAWITMSQQTPAKIAVPA
ncbi:MAG: asparagine synthase (glutamine-hydrolyzing) [Pyrinomonadaceae bacterium]